MKLPGGLVAWLEQQGRALPSSSAPLAGGCIADTRRLSWSDGWTAILKEDHRAPEDQFAAEAEGLRALAQAQALRIPEVYAHGRRFLLLEDLPPAPRSKDYWSTCGQRLALQHQQRSPQFGFAIATYCGATRQCNDWQEDGHHFFASCRLLDLGQRCHQRGLCNAGDLSKLERLCQRLPELVPKQDACLLHGDLWSGNLHTDQHGQPALIDPACYYGWPEAELAMTKLFGGFAPAFYAAYEEASGIDRQWQERSDIYNLYHLLNHALLFAGGYVSQAHSVIERYH